MEHWFRLGRTLTRAARRDGAGVVERQHVRVPDADAGDAVVPLHRCSTRPAAARCAARSRTAARARRPVGRERERLQRARPPPHLSVPRVRRSRPRAQARAGPRPGHRAVRLGARGHGRRPSAALANLAALEKQGALGPYGFRDALDYTRPEPGEPFARGAHLHGAPRRDGLVALANALDRRSVWQRRFHADPLVRSAELLLHERMPRRLVLQEPQAARPTRRCPTPRSSGRSVREVDTPDTPAAARRAARPPALHDHGEPLRARGTAATRSWRSPAGGPTATPRRTRASSATCRTSRAAAVWSAAHQPVCAPADCVPRLPRDRPRHLPSRSTARSRPGPRSPSVPADARRGAARDGHQHRRRRPREIELTSYGEIVLAPPDADRAHPAFGNLFVETEWHDWCTRDHRHAAPALGAGADALVRARGGHGQGAGRAGDLRDRPGPLPRPRAHRPADPAALDADGPLSRHHRRGARSDLRAAGAGAARARAVGRRWPSPRSSPPPASGPSSWPTATTIRTPRSARSIWPGRRRRSSCASSASRPADAGVFQELAGHLFYANPALRAPPDELRRNRGPQPLLWAIGVSGDWPILLATIDSEDGLPTLRQLLAAHRYWRRRGMTVDLVVLNARGAELPPGPGATGSSPRSTPSPAPRIVDRPGGVFVRRRDLLGGDDAARCSAPRRGCTSRATAARSRGPRAGAVRRRSDVRGGPRAAAARARAPSRRSC